MTNPYNNTFDAIKKQLLADDEFCMELAKTYDDPWKFDSTPQEQEFSAEVIAFTKRVEANPRLWNAWMNAQLPPEFDPREEL